jgi:hypothetical protein
MSCRSRHGMSSQKVYIKDDVDNAYDNIDNDMMIWWWIYDDMKFISTQMIFINGDVDNAYDNIDNYMMIWWWIYIMYIFIY